MTQEEAVREAWLFNRMVSRNYTKRKTVTLPDGKKWRKHHPNPALKQERINRRNTLGKRVVCRIKDAGYKIHWRLGRIYYLKHKDKPDERIEVKPLPSWCED